MNPETIFSLSGARPKSWPEVAIIYVDKEKLKASPNAKKMGPNLFFWSEDFTTNGTMGRIHGENIVSKPAKNELMVRLMDMSFLIFDQLVKLMLKKTKLLDLVFQARYWPLVSEKIYLS